MDDYAHRELLSVPPKLYFSLVNNYMGGHTLTWRVVDMNGESLDREHKTLNKHITDGKTKLTLSSNANAKENIQLNKQNTNREQLMEMTPVEQARQHGGVWIQPNDSQRFKHGFR
ncbi:hypothetical protein BofuT4_P045650.1 [Botrytis cinerea T4]|uniref:Uncharacterized protein n=1 Tax=Botryotinia fuckeliana (strain T4) TaxID=999810 RepID=G2XYL0_BOTF4|nr:hypothetical protein BofuT4_P045650.1 [Botrytis cinerea T4]